MARNIKPKKSTSTGKKGAKPTLLRPGEQLSHILQTQGPMLSSTAAQRFKSSGVNAPTARQRISRLPADADSLKGVTFPKRARFIFHKDDIGTRRYYQALEVAIRESSPPMSAALDALGARAGLMTLRQFIISCGSPVRQKNQVSADRVGQQLESSGLVRKIDIGGLGECVVMGGTSGIELRTSSMRAHAMAESFLLDAIAGWLGRMNMVSPNAVSIRSEEMSPRFSTFEFDLCGPSYLSPLTSYKSNKRLPGFTVCDVILGKELTQSDVAPFLRKCRTLKGARGNLPFLPMLIADGFQSQALHDCRASGVIATRAETLFGRDVAMGLGSLLEVLKATTLAPADRIDYILKRLSAIEGAAGNLRGALFEMVTCHLVTELEGGTAEVGVVTQLSATGQRAEIDVLLRKQRDFIAYECKGHQPTSSISLSEIEKWLHKQIPLIFKSLSEEHGNMIRVAFEYWTCGTFRPQALEALQKAAANTDRYEIRWKDKTAIHEYAQGLSSSGVRKHLADHFFSTPLSRMLAS